MTEPDPLATVAGGGSVANLDRPETPAVPRVDAPLHHVATTIVIVGIVVTVVRIAIIRIIGVVEAVPYTHRKRGERKAAVVESVVETAAVETGEGCAAKSRTDHRG